MNTVILRYVREREAGRVVDHLIVLFNDRRAHQKHQVEIWCRRLLARLVTVFDSDRDARLVEGFEREVHDETFYG